VVPVLDMEIGGGEFITMAGPCSVETEFQLMATANHVRRAGARILRGGAFKPRSSPYAFQGLGLEGLKMLARARQESGLAIVTEVMSEDDVPLVAEYADILQIGSRNMENYALLEAAARSGRPILLKRGMVATIADLLRSAQCILDNGNPQVILCERGIRTFDTRHAQHLRRGRHRAAQANLASAGDCRSQPRGRASRPGSGAGAHCRRRRRGWPAGRGASQPGQGVERRRTVAGFRGFDEMMAALDPWIALRGLELARRERGAPRRELAGARPMQAVR
jgi:hypothetical protein